MAIKPSGIITLDTDIPAEFGGARPHSLSEYYRGGSFVKNISYNQNVPASGSISLSDYYNGRNITSSSFTVPSYETQNFNSNNGGRSYRVLTSFNISENSRFFFSVNYDIMGDEREPNTFTSTNRTIVENPRISIYAGGTASNGGTSPTGTEIAFDQDSARSDDDDRRVPASANVSMQLANIGDSIVFAPPGVIYVVASMECRRAGGPDAPLARWRSPSFTVTRETG